MANIGIANLEVLEEKINKAAELILKLRREKNEIEAANKELKEKIESLYIENKELTKEHEIFKNRNTKEKDFKETREEIKNKIEEMLSKLEDLDI